MNNDVNFDAKGLLSYNLKRLLESRGLTPSIAATQSDISESQFSVYLNKKRFPGPENISAIAEFFDVKISDLFKSPKEWHDELDRNGQKMKIAIIGDTTSAEKLTQDVDECEKNGIQKKFYISVSNNTLLPYAERNDLLRCTFASYIANGRMLLVNEGGKLNMYRCYSNAVGDGYMLVSEKRTAPPIFLSPENPVVRVLAVVLSCQHNF